MRSSLTQEHLGVGLVDRREWGLPPNKLRARDVVLQNMKREAQSSNNRPWDALVRGLERILELDRVQLGLIDKEAVLCAEMEKLDQSKQVAFFKKTMAPLLEQETGLERQRAEAGTAVTEAIKRR